MAYDEIDDGQASPPSAAYGSARRQPPGPATYDEGTYGMSQPVTIRTPPVGAYNQLIRHGSTAGGAGASTTLRAPDIQVVPSRKGSITASSGGVAPTAVPDNSVIYSSSADATRTSPAPALDASQYSVSSKKRETPESGVPSAAGAYIKTRQPRLRAHTAQPGYKRPAPAKQPQPGAYTALDLDGMPWLSNRGRAQSDDASAAVQQARTYDRLHIDDRTGTSKQHPCIACPTRPSGRGWLGARPTWLKACYS